MMKWFVRITKGCILALACVGGGTLVNLLREEPWSPISEEQEVAWIEPWSREQVMEIAFGDPGILVDAREKVFYEQGFIFGAVNLSVGDLQGDVEKKIPRGDDAPIVVYCSGQDCHDSKRVAKWLVKHGWKNVGVYVGGIEDWLAHDLPLDTK